MNDLISRQAAIDAIHNLYAIHGSEGSWIDQKDAFKALNSLPSAQPEIIRCKECEDYQTDWETSYPNRHYCATMDSMMSEDGFCSYAERRTDDLQ